MKLKQYCKKNLHHTQYVTHTTVAAFDISSVCHSFKRISDIELAFLVPTSHSVNLNPGNWGEKTADYLARQVARNPDNLRNHIQRINLNIKLKNRNGTYSALLDLFIAVENKGKYLRKRMLGRSKILLNKHKYKIMKDNIDQGINALTVMPLATSSILGMGLTGTPDLLKHVK